MPVPKNYAILTLSSASALDTLLIVVAEPPEEARRRLGTFFAVVKADEIPSLVPWLKSFVQYLEHSFYQTLSDGDVTIERALGVVRQRAKLKLQQLTQETRTLSADAVHYCFGTLRGRQLSLLHSGDMVAYLLHVRPKTNDDPQRLQWVNITAVPLRRGAPQIEQSASTIVSGTIGEHDTVLVATESLIDGLGLPKLEKILPDTPLEAIVALLTRDLKNLNQRFSYGALCFRRSLLAPEVRDRKTVTSSMENLRQYEAGTDAVLGGAPRLLDSARTSWRDDKTDRGRLSKSSPPLTARRSGQQAGKILRRLTAALLRAGTALIQAPLTLIVVVTNSERRTEISQALRRWPENMADSLLSWIRRQPRSSQRLLVVALLFAFLFTQSLVFLAQREKEQQNNAANEETIAALQDLLDRAESNIVFHNDDAAGALVLEAEQKLPTVPQKTPKEQERWRVLSGRIQDLKNQLMRLVIVSQPTLVTMLASSPLAPASGLFSANDGLYVYRGETNAIAQVNTTNGAVDVRPVTSVNVGHLERPLLSDDGQSYFLTDTPSIALLDPSTTALTATPVTNPPAGLTDAAIYRNRLYLLDATNQQIWRAQKTTSGYQSGAPWVKGSVPDLANGTSLAIDVDVFALLQNGAIIKLTQGVAQSWRAQTPIPEATKATLLIAPANQPFLYAMDASTHRIFVWNRESGQLIHQYQFSSLHDLLGYHVDTKTQTLYILTSDGIYKNGITP